MSSRFTIILAVLLLNLSLAACQQPTPTEEIIPTIPQATPTPQPTRTPSPTFTPTQPPELEAWLEPEFDLQYHSGEAIVVYFNQPMDPDSAAAPLVFIPEWQGEYEWQNDFTILVFTPTQGIQDSTQIIEVSIKLASRSGKTLVKPPQWKLVTGAQAYVSYLPAGGKLSPDDPTIELNFLAPMDTRSVEAALSIEPEIAYSLEWALSEIHGDTNRRLLIHLDEPLSTGQSVILKLSSQAATLRGRAVKAVEWIFTMPELSANFQRQQQASRRAPFEFVFNYAMDEISTLEALSVTPSFAYTTTWVTETKKLLLTPLEPLSGGQIWQFSLAGDIWLKNGKPALHETLSWEYTVPDTVKTLYWDESGKSLTLEFNIPLDPDSASAALRLMPSFAYTTTWMTNYTRLILTPLHPLPGLISYSLSFSGEFKDGEGLPLRDDSLFHFTTPSPLPEWSHSPGWENTIKSKQDVLFLFNRAVQITSTLAALSIDPPIAGEWRLKDASTLQLTPSTPLPECALYKLSMQPSALDSEGYPLLSTAQVWLLRTDESNQAGFGSVGSKIQVIDSAGRRALHLGLNEALSVVRLELYRLTLEEFIAADPSRSFNNWRGSCRELIRYDVSQAALQAIFEAPVKIIGEGWGRVGEVILPADLPDGMYIINLVTDHLDDQMLVALTSSTLALKYTTGINGVEHVTAWLSDINGGVLPGARVRIYDQQGEEIANGLTDDEGVLQTYLVKGSQPYLAAAWWGDSLTLSGFSGVWDTRGSWWWWGIPSIPFTMETDEYAAFIYTDRPIYRPGQQVNYKGIVRVDNDVRYRLPEAGFKANLLLRDARENIVSTYPVTLSGFGTFSGTLDLAEGASLGDFTLELQIGGESHQQTFQVQEYTKPDIELKVSADLSAYLPGETVNLQVEARYLFGQPVANAALKVHQFRIDTGWYGDAYWMPVNRIPMSASLTSGADGLANFSLNLPKDIVTYYYDYYSDRNLRWAFEVTIDDGSGQQVSAFTTISIFSSAYQARIKTGGFLFPPQEPLPVSIQLSSPFAEPLEGQALTLKVSQWRRGNSDNYPVIQTQELVSSADGRAQAALNLPEGAYRLEVSGKDQLGNAYSAERWVYIYDFTSAWLLDYTTELSLETEERDYRPGETAQVLVKSNFSGEALLTIERGRVLSQRMVRLTAPFTLISVPILPEYTPNVYVVVQAWRPLDTDLSKVEYPRENIPDAILRHAAAQLIVPDLDHALAVSVTPDREHYAPGQAASFTVRVTDAQGDPVKAEVSLALVDEAIFLLADDPAGDIHAGLYRPRPLSVNLSDSLAPWRYLPGPDARGGGGGDGYYYGNPRSDFPDTALWLPAVVTDENGEAQVTLTLPDSLTTWRLTARAITLETKAGQGQAKIVAQQAIIVRPLLPLSLTSGDSFELAALVHNYSAESLLLTVTAGVSGLELGTPGAT